MRPTWTITEALVDSCEKAVADMARQELARCTPAEQQLFERLTMRLMQAMEAACMTDNQIHGVIGAFLETAREMCEALERFDDDDDGDEFLDQPEPEPALIEIEVACVACRRALGRTLIPEACRELVEPMKCPGCLREGR